MWVFYSIYNVHMIYDYLFLQWPITSHCYKIWNKNKNDNFAEHFYVKGFNCNDLQQKPWHFPGSKARMQSGNPNHCWADILNTISLLARTTYLSMTRSWASHGPRSLFIRKYFYWSATQRLIYVGLLFVSCRYLQHPWSRYLELSSIDKVFL